MRLHCTVPYFGFKAKRAGNLGKCGKYCTVPYFGFKAKLSLSMKTDTPDCTVPYFGFKAKRSIVGVSFKISHKHGARFALNPK